MALKLTGLAKLDDGSHVAPCSSHINSYTTTSGGQTFVVSGGAMVRYAKLFRQYSPGGYADEPNLVYAHGTSWHCKQF